MIATGIDTGTALGKGCMVCVLSDDHATFHRCASKLKPLLPRLREILDRVAVAAMEEGPIGLENPMGRVGNARQLHGAYWLIADQLEGPDSPVYSIAPTSLKKFVTGNGGPKMDKAMIATACVRQWACLLDDGQDLDADEADALGLALMALCAAGGENPNGKGWTAYQVEAAGKAERL